MPYVFILLDGGIILNMKQTLKYKFCEIWVWS